MGYEDEMHEYHQERELKEQYKFKFSYKVPAGTYYANSIWGLMWEVFTHRLWHLFKHGRWMD